MTSSITSERPTVNVVAGAIKLGKWTVAVTFGVRMLMYVGDEDRPAIQNATVGLREVISLIPVDRARLRKLFASSTPANGKLPPVGDNQTPFLCELTKKRRFVGIASAAAWEILRDFVPATTARTESHGTH